MSVLQTSTRVALSGAAVLACFAFAAPGARAQGCVASRGGAPSCNALNSPADSDGVSFYLPKKHWEASVGYRWFRSHRHFVHAEEQLRRETPINTQIVNKVHQPDLAATYGVSDRLSVTATLPFLIADRKTPGTIYATRTPPVFGFPDQHTQAHGISDATLVGHFWLGEPRSHAQQNVALGLGLKFPTGKDDVTDTFVTPTATTVRPVDQSIQPGDGGYGIVTDLQAFKAAGPVTLFASGYYLFNPKATNGVATNRSRITESIMSVADQYAGRLGVAGTLPIGKGLGWSLAARLEGVPARDVFGSSAGFRRPGYSIGIEPGLSFAHGRNAVSLSVPWLVRRVRTTSVSDTIESAKAGTDKTGDAAFADYIVVVGFSRRF